MATALALRHVPFEDLGILESLLKERGFDVVYRDVPVAGIDGVDAAAPELMIVLGGPIGVYERETYPFLTKEIRAIERRLAADKPTLGICLGAQLMAEALGARVAPMGVKEIGWYPLTLTEAGRQGCLAPVDGTLTHAFHWHGDSFDIPAGAENLASTEICANQAFSWQGKALALQFHVEAAGQALESWFVGHAAEIAATPGVSVTKLREDTARWSTTMTAQGRLFFRGWLSRVGL